MATVTDVNNNPTSNRFRFRLDQLGWMVRVGIHAVKECVCFILMATITPLFW